jgi:exodeoxyribonuclease V alpha subunit
MSATLHEITAKFIRERQRFKNADGDVTVGDAFINGEVSKTITIKGQADLDELVSGLEYRFFGKLAPYTNKRTRETEEQFHFQSFVPVAPHNRDGIIAYLVQHGQGYGLGVSRARKLHEIFGSDAVKKLRENPRHVADQLTTLGHHYRLRYEDAEAIAEELNREAGIESCTLDLMDLLAGRKFRKSTAKLAVKEWGNRAAQIIRRNPYRLMQFKGCGFRLCDNLYLDLKLDPHAIRRQGLCIWHTLAKDTEGHSWYPSQFAEAGLRGVIQKTEVKFDEARKFARRLGATAELATRMPNGPISETGNTRWIAEGVKARHELEVAEHLATARGEATYWPNPAMLNAVSDHQRAELAKCLIDAIAILGGGPGTGKTYCVAALAKWLSDHIGADQIIIGAPTGKAAVRVTENLARYGLSIRARTWHSLLMQRESEAKRFQKNVVPFDAKVLIGDESSMLDTDLFARILRHRSVGTNFLIVGDVNQLPPIGHGAPLRDMIAAGLPTGTLTEIKRNSGGIVEACAAIRESRKWQPGDNLELSLARNADVQIADMLRTIRESKVANRIWDIQVVVAVNAANKSPLARQALNKILQNELNPTPGSDGEVFRVGDKIVNTKNGKFTAILSEEPIEDDFSERDSDSKKPNEVYVANGELAEVIEVGPGYLLATLTNPNRTIRIPRGKAQERDETPLQSDDGEDAPEESTSTGCTFDLGYALSVHKSQGSEWPVVIVMLDDSGAAKRTCSREWLYTAISRAKDRCVLIGRRETADSMCGRVALNKRKTLLKERIHLTRAELLLADM